MGLVFLKSHRPLLLIAGPSLLAPATDAIPVRGSGRWAAAIFIGRVRSFRGRGLQAASGSLRRTMHAERCGCWKRPFFRRRLTAPRLGFRLGGAWRLGSSTTGLRNRCKTPGHHHTTVVSLGNHVGLISSAPTSGSAETTQIRLSHTANSVSLTDNHRIANRRADHNTPSEICAGQRGKPRRDVQVCSLNGCSASHHTGTLQRDAAQACAIQHRSVVRPRAAGQLEGIPN